MSYWHEVRKQNKKFREIAKSHCYQWEDGFHWYGPYNSGDQRDWTFRVLSGYQMGPIGESNLIAATDIMKRYIARGDAEVESFSGMGGHEAIAVRVFTDKGRITAAFRHWYENVVQPLEEYPVLDEDLWSECEYKEKQRAFDEAWNDVLSHIDAEDDDISSVDNEQVKWEVFLCLDGAKENPATGSYESIEVDDSAWVDPEKHIIPVLVAMNLIHGNDSPDNFYGFNPKHWDIVTKDPVDMAMEEAKKYQMGFALGEIEHEYA